MDSILLEALSLDCERVDSVDEVKESFDNNDDINNHYCDNGTTPLPAYLLRLMEDSARRRGLVSINNSIESITPTNTIIESYNSSSTDFYSLSTSPETTASSYTSSNTNISDISPKPFSNYNSTSSSSSSTSTSTGGNNSVVSSSVYTIAPPPLPLPPAIMLDLPGASLNSLTNSTSTITTTGNEKSITGTMTPISYANKRLEDVYTLAQDIVPEEDLLPPENFAMVASFVYRSSFPKRKNFPFLKSLGLKSVL